MRSRTILFSLTLLCCLIAAAGVAANYMNLMSFAQKDARRNAESIVTMINHEVDATFRGRISQVAVQSALPEIQHFLQGGAIDVTPLLNNICNLNDASICYLLDSRGAFVASSEFEQKQQTLGKSFSFRPYFKEAISGGSAIYPALGYSTRRRGLYFAHRVVNEQGHFIGVVVNKFSLSELETRFDQLSGRLALMDGDGVVFASNMKDWVFSSLLPLDRIQQRTIINNSQYGSDAPQQMSFEWLSETAVRDSSGHDYSVYREPVNPLPGWSLVYMTDSDISLSGGAENRLLILLLALSLVVVVLVTMLFRHGSQQIRRRLDAETSLRQSETRLLQLSQVSTEAVVMHRGNEIIDFNEVAERMFGYDRQLLLSTQLLQLFNADSAIETEAYYNVGEHNFETEGMRLDGVYFPIEVNFKSTLIDGESVGMSCIRDISERKEHEEKVRYQSQFDALTNLPNRKLMKERLNRAINRARLNNYFTVLMFIDLDDFKKINDTLGHEVGDELLVMAAKRLQDCVRDEDTLARYGGDEFILLLENQEDINDAETVAKKILTMLSMEFRVQGRSFYISGSIGIAVSPADGLVANELLKCADTAMYQVKDEGRNGYCFYTPDMNSDMSDRIEIEHQLRGALERNELSLNYQPIYCLHHKKLMGVEVLLRWNNGVLGSIPPDKFIPIAEQTGLIIPIGEWIIRQACLQGLAWNKDCGENYRIALNVSPRQFRNGHIVQVLLRVLDETGFDPSLLVIEITEGLLIRNDKNTAQTLSRIKAMGITLSMDDFGTGYSSLSYLKQFPFDIIKIDQSFVRELADDPGDQQLVTAAVAMAKGLGLKVIAEGVETDFQASYLTSAGCDALQGYFLGYPVTAEEFMAKVIPPKEFKALVTI